MARYSIESDGTRVVTLTKPIDSHKGFVTEIRLRPPLYRDFIKLGDPTAMVYSETALIPQDDLAVVRGYITVLANVEEALIERQADLADAIALRDAVKSFFLPASADTSPRSPTRSPSAPASIPGESS